MLRLVDAVTRINENFQAVPEKTKSDRWLDTLETHLSQYEILYQHGAVYWNAHPIFVPVPKPLSST